MALFNITKDISTSPLQNNVFLDGSPVNNTILQKGIKYNFNSSTSSCLWATQNKTDTDFLLSVNGNRKSLLVRTEEVDVTNAIIVEYMPYTICPQETQVITPYDTEPVNITNSFRLFDFATGHNIVGQDSGAVAAITSFSVNYSPNLNIALTYDNIEGEFIAGERLSIQGLEQGTIHTAYGTQASAYSLLPNFMPNIMTLVDYPYVVAEEAIQRNKACFSFTRFVSKPFDKKIEFDSFARESIVARNCREEVTNQITLQYSPNLLRLYCDEVIADWDGTAIQKVQNFPYYREMLLGQTIKGWHSRSEAVVDSITQKYSGNGDKYFVLSLKNMTGDFYPQEPVEILTLNQSDIMDMWMRVFTDYSVAAPNIYDDLKRMLTRPFYTASSVDNALYTGQITDEIEAIRSSIGISTSDGCVIDPSLYQITLEPVTDYARDCTIAHAFIPEGLLSYQIEFSPEIEIGTSLRIKTDVVSFVEGNGSSSGFSFEVPANSTVERFWINDGTYSLNPLEVDIIVQSMASRAFRMDDIISEYVTSEYPDFRKFMEYYFSYTHSIGQGSYFLNNSTLLSSLNCIPSDLLDEIAKETLGPANIGDLYRSRTFQKEFVSFWNQNGTDAAMKYFFKLFYDEDAEICHSCNSVFTASGDSMQKDTWIYILSAIDTNNTDGQITFTDWTSIPNNLTNFDSNTVQNYFVGQTIRGKKSRAEGIIEEVKQQSVNGTNISVLALRLSHISESFSSFEHLDILGTNGEIFDTTTKEILKEEDSVKYDLYVAYGVNLVVLDSIFSNVNITTNSLFMKEGDLLNIPTASGFQNGKIWVSELESDGSVKTITTDIGINVVTQASPIQLQKLDSGGNLVDFITVDVSPSTSYTTQGYYETRNSFTDSYVVLEDLYFTDPNFYTVSVKKNRSAYSEKFDSMIREAGSLAYSEYPFDITLPKSQRSTSSFVEISQLPWPT